MPENAHQDLVEDRPLWTGSTAPARPEATPAEVSQDRAKAGTLGARFARYSILLLLLCLVVMSQLLYPGFLEPDNLINILNQNAMIGLIAIGMTFVMIGGGFDLSVASIYAGATVLYASWAQSMPISLTFALVLLAGLTAGLVNGLLVTQVRVNPFVATLGTGSVFSGAALLYSGSTPISYSGGAFDYLGTASIAGLPVAVILLIVAFGLGGFVLARTTFGQAVYAAGGNFEAARLAGIRVELTRVITYLLTAGCAALAGVIIASRTGVGQADFGASLTLDSIAVVIIGGTSLRGGEGAVWRTLVGLLILGVINNLFDSLALSGAMQAMAKGLIVIAAVAIDALIRARRD